MNKATKIKYRKKVRDKYLTPKLYELGYSKSNIKYNSKLLIEKGRRKVFIRADMSVELNSNPAIIIAVRYNDEEITDYLKGRMLAYARLLDNPAPIIVITNGIETKVYDVYTGKNIEEIPSKDKLNKLILTSKIDQRMKDEALDNIFSLISLWDKTEQKSPYHFKDIRAYDDPNENTPFTTDLFHDYNYFPDIPNSIDEVSIRVSSKRNLVDKVYLYYTTDGSNTCYKQEQAKNVTKIDLEKKYTEIAPNNNILIDWWECKIPAQSDGTIVKYLIQGYDSEADKLYFTEQEQSTLKGTTKFSYLVDNYSTPNWAKEAIVYEIFVDRFYQGNSNEDYRVNNCYKSYQGGNLQGVIDKLDYISDLGVNAIWLTPFYSSEGYHGYHIKDYLKVDYRFGDNKLLKELVDKAHQYDLKVIFDFVPNHCSNQHPFFQEAQRSKDSLYYDWFIFYNWPEDYEAFCGIKELPKLNTNNPSVRDYLINQVAIKLIQEYDIDGIRIDHIEGLSHDFWVEFRKTIKEFSPDTYIFGEVWQGPGITKKYTSQLDGCFDFALVWSFRELFIYGSKNISEFKEDLDYLDEVYPQEFNIGRFLDNHDMNRFLWEAEGEKQRLKLAAVCQFTLRGTQFIYYGTEVGLSQDRDCRDDNTGDIIYDYSRKFMHWGEEQDKELYDFYRNLCKIRRNNKALSLGKRKDLVVDDDTGIFIYSKIYNQQQLIIILNTKDKTNKINLNLEGLKVKSKTNLVDLLSLKEYKVKGGRLELTLDNLTGAILK
ncbi:alpha-amylase family glycosyl hydrolase [Halonatronum saccharophilum]|uniref:alpha-amylase family glycosyl hydrolase n=1 Tax=Halonatronum saccharophilum TaxID=150060 RepID=UPI0004B46E06|nr:alpha-amylase family glycosyl hydrolase [Halonatronum saccharophilum]